MNPVRSLRHKKLLLISFLLLLPSVATAISIDELSHSPNSPQAGETVTISVRASDSDGIVRIQFYAGESAPYQKVGNECLNQTSCSAKIGPFEEETAITYYALVYNNIGGFAWRPTNSFTVQAPECTFNGGCFSEYQYCDEDKGRCENCSEGYKNCDFVRGCEIDTRTDENNCGDCRIVCDTAAGETCEAGLCVGGEPPPPPPPEPTLEIKVSADPSSGPAPLENVKISARVTGGTATGDVRYRLGCHNDGTWNTGWSLSAGTSYTFGTTCNYPATGSYEAAVEAKREGASATALVLINVGLPAEPVISVTPALFDFGDVTKDTKSEIQFFTVSNSGGRTLKGTVQVDGPFTITEGSSFELSVGQIKLVGVRFNPVAIGDVTKSVIFSSNGGDATQEVSGNGVAVPTISRLSLSNNSNPYPDGDVYIVVTPAGLLASDRAYYSLDCGDGKGWIAERVIDGTPTNGFDFFSVAKECSYSSEDQYKAKVRMEVERNDEVITDTSKELTIDIVSKETSSLQVSPSSRSVKKGEEYTLTLFPFGPVGDTLTTRILEEAYDPDRTTWTKIRVEPFGECEVNNEGACPQKSWKISQDAARKYRYTGIIASSKTGEVTTNQVTVTVSGAAAPGNGDGNGKGGRGDTMPPISIGKIVEFKNPLKDIHNFPDLLSAITSFIFWVGMALAPLLLIISGFLFVVSAGDPGKLKTAKNMALYTVIGIVVILLATGLVEVLKSVLGAE